MACSHGHEAVRILTGIRVDENAKAAPKSVLRLTKK